MAWKHAFRVGHVTVGIVSEHPGCSDIIRTLICLYAETNASPDIPFFIRCKGDTIELAVDDTVLWSGTDAGEIVAGFEVHLYTRILQHLSPAYSSIHASAINIGNQACIFAGESNAGKSSLCTAALLDGADYLSDEFALLDENGLIEPFPRPLQWGKARHPAFPHHAMLSGHLFAKAYFRFPDHQGKTVCNLLWLPANVEHQALPLRYLLLPCYRRNAPPAELTSIRRGEALMALPEHLHHRDTPEAMLKTLNHRLPEATEFFRLEFSDAHAAYKAVKQHLCA
ncbi:MAG: hypothetical protein ACE5F3_00115 [Mariprofundaceae bacterium]